MSLWVETLSNLKTWLGSTSTADDALLTAILEGVQASFDRYCDRTFLLTATDVTETFNGGFDVIAASRYPIVSVTSIKEAADWDFASATALTADSDYRVRVSNGLIHRTGKWLRGVDVIQVLYRGGYVAAGSTPGAGETALPDEIKLAARIQAEHIYRHKEQFGLTSVSIGGAAASVSSAGLLPEAARILDAHRRRGI
jgi:hypothetical protein